MRAGIGVGGNERPGKAELRPSWRIAVRRGQAPSTADSRIDVPMDDRAAGRVRASGWMIATAGVFAGWDPSPGAAAGADLRAHIGRAHVRVQDRFRCGIFAS